MLLVCLVPFTSARQAISAFAHGGPVQEAPAPVSQEDDERETDSKERLNAQAKHRSHAREYVGSLPRAHASRPTCRSSARTKPPVAADPFRNGLGSPYRC
jgi:hypothetical protein